MMNPRTPNLSVILIIGNQRERAVQALNSLLSQSLIDQLEILLLDCGLPELGPVPGSEHPNVQIIRLKPGLPAGWVRAEGVRQSRAPVVVFLEEHACALQGWAEVILSTLNGPWVGVGPEVINGNPKSGISPYLELMFYPTWSPPAKGGPSAGTPLHNCAYKREVLLAYGPLLDVLMYPESIVQRRLVLDGHRLYVAPEMKIVHFYETELSLLPSGEFNSHRAMGALISHLRDFPFSLRPLRLLVLPLVPWSRVFRLLWLLLRKRPAHFSQALRGSLLILIIEHICVAGEFTGLIFGLGKSAEAFLDYQINIYRKIPAQPNIAWAGVSIRPVSAD